MNYLYVFRKSPSFYRKEVRTVENSELSPGTFKLFEWEGYNCLNYFMHNCKVKGVRCHPTEQPWESWFHHRNPVTRCRQPWQTIYFKTSLKNQNSRNLSKIKLILFKFTYSQFAIVHLINQFFLFFLGFFLFTDFLDFFCICCEQPVYWGGEFSTAH